MIERIVQYSVLVAAPCMLNAVVLLYWSRSVRWIPESAYYNSFGNLHKTSKLEGEATVTAASPSIHEGDWGWGVGRCHDSGSPK